MARRGKHFTLGSPGTAGPRTQGFSPRGKGFLLGLFIVCAGFVLFGVATPQSCAPGLGSGNYVSVNVGGFSMYIRWSALGCR